MIHTIAYHHLQAADLRPYVANQMNIKEKAARNRNTMLSRIDNYCLSNGDAHTIKVDLNETDSFIRGY